MKIESTKLFDTYLEPSQTFMMEFFSKIVNGSRKKAPLQILDWVLNTPLSILRSQESVVFVFFQRRSHWGSQGGAQPPILQFPNQTRSTVSVSNTRGVAFNQCSEIIRTRNFTTFNVHALILGQFTAACHFSN